MLRSLGLGEAERIDQLTDPQLARADRFEDGAPVRIANSVEHIGFAVDHLTETLCPTAGRGWWRGPPAG